MGRTGRARSDDDRGQSGVGTLVVFIAVILVATIAATVLIDTAGVLRIQASDTSSESQGMVSSQVDIVYAGGVVEQRDGDDERVTTLNLIIKNGGREPIDLTSTTVQYTSSSTSRTLTYGEEAGTFETESLTDGSNGERLTDRDDRVQLTIDVEALEDGGGLEAGDSASLQVIDGSGGRTTYRVTVPGTLETEGIVEV